MNSLERGTHYNYPRNIPSQNQTGIMNGYSARLNYDMAKSGVELRQNQIMNEQRLQLQYGLEDIKLRFKICADMLETTVYKNYAGDLIFAFSDSNGNKVSVKKLLNVKGYKAELLVSEMAGRKSALQILWDGSENIPIFFTDIAQGISPNSFLKKLKSHGVLFQVSGRMEKKAAEALLVYSIQTAKTTEIPACYGWCKMSNGCWHFAGADEMTMRRIEEYDR